MQYFGEPEGLVKIQMTSKNVQRLLHTKMSIKRFIIQLFLFLKFCIVKFFLFRAVGGIRRVQISLDIGTRLARYLYSTN